MNDVYVIVLFVILGTCALTALILATLAYLKTPELASDDKHGLLSAADKRKLAGIADSATRVVTALDINFLPTGKITSTNLQGALEETLGLFSPRVSVRAPLNTDDVSHMIIPGSNWVDVTKGLHYICTDNTAGSAIWKETTATAVTGFFWHIQKGSVSGAAIDSTAVGWNVRTLDATILVSSGSEVSLVPILSGDVTQIKISNTTDSPRTYTVSAKSAARNVGMTEVRFRRVSGVVGNVATSSVLNSSNDNQVYPDLFGRFEVSASTDDVFELQQYCDSIKTAGLGSAGPSTSNTEPTVYVDIVLMRVA